VLLSCTHQSDKQALENRISVLEKKIDSAYKPDFGEFMSGIQVHHNKLWFAGEAQNWKLAGFEVKEIREAMENIKKYEKDRNESQSIDMIMPAIDSVIYAINQNDPVLFERSYSSLTNLCNDCHKVNDFEYNLIKKPDSPAFTNQVFKPEAQ
jgi:hypothetical protein